MGWNNNIFGSKVYPQITVNWERFARLNFCGFQNLLDKNEHPLCKEVFIFAMQNPNMKVMAVTKLTTGKQSTLKIDTVVTVIII